MFRLLPLCLMLACSVLGAEEMTITTTVQEKDNRTQDGHTDFLPKEWKKTVDTQKPYNDLQGACFRANLHRTGTLKTKGLATQAQSLWTQNVGATESSPVVYDGTVYVGGKKGIYAINATDGSERWHLPVKKGVASSACIANGLLYMGDNVGTMHVVDIETGTEKKAITAKSLKVKTGIIKSSVAYAFEAIFYSVGETQLIAVDPVKGTLLWKLDPQSSAAYSVKPGGLPRTNSPIITESGMLIGQFDEKWGHAGMVDAATSEVMWAKRVDSDIFGCGDSGYFNTHAYKDGLVYVIASRGLHVVTDTAKNLSDLWHGIVTEGVGTNDFRQNTAPTLWKNNVYFGVDAGIVYGMDTTKSKKPKYHKLWEFAVPSKKPVNSAPTVSSEDGLLVFGCHDGNVYCLDATSGKHQWTAEVGAPVITTPWVDKGNVFVTTKAGDLVCLGE